MKKSKLEKLETKKLYVPKMYTIFVISWKMNGQYKLDGVI